MIKKGLAGILLLSLAAACENVGSVSAGRFGPDVARSSGSDDADRSRGILSGRFWTQERSPTSRGSDQFLDPDAFADSGASRAEITVVNDDLVEVTLVNASIEAAAEAVIGEILGAPYTVAADVDGTITLQSTGPIQKSALLDLFRSSLAGNNTRLDENNGVFSVTLGGGGDRRFATANQAGIDGSNIVVAPLQYVSAAQMMNILEPLIADGLSATPDANRNLLLLSGSRGQIEASIDALNLFDVDVMRGKSVALVALDAADPADVVEELRAIFESETGGLLDGVIEFIPNSRLNSVLVLTSRSSYLDDAKRWIRELDRTAGRSRRYTKVYPLQNRQAADIAPVLNSLLADVSPSGGSAEPEGGDGSEAPASSRVAADPTRNALIVRGVSLEHAEVERLLLDLDSYAQQVALEATIAEVTLNDEVSLGVRWFLENGRLSSTFSDAGGGGIAPNFPGFSSLLAGGSAEAVLNTLAGATDVRIISSPTLVVLDNKEAILQIGDQVPIATQTATSSDDANAPVLTSIDYRDTGVILKVRPQIGSNGSLSLDINQEVSSVQATVTSGIDSPTIRQRQISTSVALRDGATLTLGGLVQEDNNRSESKVPGLGDVPYLGSAFRVRDSEKSRTELLILIRPRIISNDHDAKSYTQELRQRLAGANSNLSQGLGEARHSVDEIVR